MILKYKVKDKEDIYSINLEVRDKPDVKIEVDGETILLVEGLSIESVILDFNH